MEKTKTINHKVTPILAYGNSVLREKCNEVIPEDISVHKLIENLWNTLNISGGVGLAAPQINSSQHTFIVNSKLMYDDLEPSLCAKYFAGDKGIEEAFINAKIIDYSKDTQFLSEGCLSIPTINYEIERPWEIFVEYFDEDFVSHKKQFSGYTARVIQHELDHNSGKLFIDYLQPLAKKIIANKLKKIKTGSIKTNYPIAYLKT